jgi:hypothetical protein
MKAAKEEIREPDPTGFLFHKGDRKTPCLEHSRICAIGSGLVIEFSSAVTQ